MADHGGCPLGELLSRLEEKNHVSGQLGAVCGEKCGGAIESGGMEVVAAAVHPVGNLRDHGPAPRLLLFQCIDICPERHRPPRLPTPEEANYASLHPQINKLHTQRGQQLLQTGCGADLLKTGLRVSVEIIFQGFHVTVKRFCLRKKRHGYFLSGACPLAQNHI